MTQSDHLIHVMFEHNEAIETKSKILNTEKNLLQLLRTIKNYKSIRMEELKIKSKLQKKSKDLDTNLIKLNKLLPHIKTPDILKHKIKEGFESYEEKNFEIPIKEKIKSAQERNDEDDLEDQIREIQEKLKNLRF
jgi:hypothetical protein